MNYLSPTEYQLYGLDTTTEPSLVGAASSLIDAHCRRATLAIAQYEERIRMMPDRNTIHLTYLPLVPLGPSTSPIISGRGRYTVPRRGKWPFDDLRLDVALMFGMPGTWSNIDPASVDFDPATGELTLPLNLVGLWFSEVDMIYTAGYATIPDAVKYACAQVVRNAQATPAVNVKTGRMDRFRMDYFAPDLLDATVRSMLAPFVAQKTR
ncbi:MAG: hypothetical protein JWN74_2233 [Acidobacteriaceae bacterium]|nr:hypothetical protein [Acidobacteriaceae bacterium]